MWNPFKKVKKAVDTKLKKAAIAATLLALLSALSLPVTQDAVKDLANAVSEVVVQIMNAPEVEDEQ